MSRSITEGRRAADEVQGLLDAVELPDVHAMLDEAEGHLAAGRLDEAARCVRRAEMLLEAPNRNPFQHKKDLGVGPRGGTNKETKYWKCKGKNYKYTCKGKKGEIRKVIIDKPWKGDYNQEYKPWRSKGAGKSVNSKNAKAVKAVAKAYAKEYYKKNKAKILAKKKKKAKKK